MLADQVREVAELRRIVAALELAKAEAYEQWRAANQPLLDSLECQERLLVTAEMALRNQAVAAWQVGGKGALVPGVGIRVMSRLEYSPQEALQWARAHELALALDVKMFERIAKSADIEFVRKRDVAQATIAQDLDGILNINEGEATA